VLLGVALVLMFHFNGNSVDVPVFSRSLFHWIAHRWQNTENMSHAWIIPLVSMLFVWRQRHAFRDAPRQVASLGLGFLMLSLAMHWLGIRSQQTRLSMFSLIGCLWSIPFYLYGRPIARRLVFPCAYLLFCVPWSFVDVIAFPLRYYATIVSTALLNGLGIACTRIGTGIVTTAGVQVDVADPCSGIRSLMAILALTAAYAYLTQNGLVRQWILFSLSVPIAMAANIGRIVLLVGTYNVVTNERFRQWIHDLSGYGVFFCAILLVMGTAALLEFNWKTRFTAWKEKHKPHN
jgi:exosortase